MIQARTFCLLLSSWAFKHTDSFTWTPSVHSAHFAINGETRSLGTIYKGEHTSFLPSSTLFYRAHDAKDDDNSFTALSLITSPSFQKVGLQEDSLPKAGKESPSTNDGTAMNVPLILSFFLNQIIIITVASGLTAFFVILSGHGRGDQFVSEGILNWTGNMNSPQSSGLDFAITPTRILQGSLGAIPTIIFSNYLARSDDRRFAKANVSTINMVMTLFGLRSSPNETHPDEDMKEGRDKFKLLGAMNKTFDVAILSMLLSSVTGFCEEIIFRGLVPHMLMLTICFEDPALACVGQASLFALSHTAPQTSIKENTVVANIQFLFGLWAGLLYLITGGDLVPCMISHALYDFQVLLFFWLAVNDQIEYSYRKCREPIPADSLQEMKKIRSKFTASTISDEAFENCKRVFYLFDEDKNGHISRSEAHRGISCLAAEEILIAPSRKTVDNIFDTCVRMRDDDVLKPNMSDELRFADFVPLFLTLNLEIPLKST